ncbi:UNVERIFIED_CONTAM: putative membrane protein [Sesamum radiatum]|uniref:Membrane protein n=1 Tax=Sesamum radiatum TaxID=300843 RepID=A0AAW2LPJ3_SESRA
MGTRTGSHQLSSGLMVSGRPDHHLKERQPTIASRSVIYTGGDVKNSGDLGKMYGIDASTDPPKVPSRLQTGSARSGSNSGTLGPKSTSSGPMNKKSSSSSSSFSGPMTPIQPTGLITSGALGACSNRRSGQLDETSAPSSFKKAVYGSAVTSIGEEIELGFRVSRVAMWVFLVVAVTGLIVGAFFMAAVKKAVILVVLVAVLVPTVVILVWNYAYREQGVLGFLRKYPDAKFKDAVDGQYLKVTGVISHAPILVFIGWNNVNVDNIWRLWYYLFDRAHVYAVLWSSLVAAYLLKLHFRRYQDASMFHPSYMNTEVVVESQQMLNTISSLGDADIQRVPGPSTRKISLTPSIQYCNCSVVIIIIVRPTVVIDVTKGNKGLSPNFFSWLSERGLSGDDRQMCLKEGYIKEGSTVSVMGVVRRHDNVLMIVPPTEPVSTGCRWLCCLLPTYIQGLILTCDESQNGDVIPV